MIFIKNKENTTNELTNDVYRLDKQIDLYSF